MSTLIKYMRTSSWGQEMPQELKKSFFSKYLCCAERSASLPLHYLLLVSTIMKLKGLKQQMSLFWYHQTKKSFNFQILCQIPCDFTTLVCKTGINQRRSRHDDQQLPETRCNLISFTDRKLDAGSQSRAWDL